MSQTISRGVVDASRWSGVAASMAAFLKNWSESDGRRPNPPKGTLAAANRFFDYVLEGIGGESPHESLREQIPSMAGVSNLTIALKVISSLPVGDSTGFDQLHGRIENYRSCLRMIDENREDEISRDSVEELIVFFRELQHQGNEARHVRFARSEVPLF